MLLSRTVLWTSNGTKARIDYGNQSAAADRTPEQVMRRLKVWQSEDG
jgi:hypothetical protein